MQLIIVQGQSGTGKTTMARKLVKELGCAYFLKDEYKEELFKDHGKVPALHTLLLKMEGNTWQTLYDAVSRAIAADSSLLIEGNFRRRQRRTLRKLLKPNVEVAEIYCYARGWLPLKRYVSRNRSGERHKGHRDNLWYVFVWLDIILSKIGVRIYGPLRLSPATLEVDTSDFSKINYDEILTFIRRAT